MNVLKTFFLSLFVFSIFGSLLLTAPKAQAGDYCTGLYGGGSRCIKITLDKKVLKPGTKDYVDNLTSYDPKYYPNDTVNFQIVVRNTGDEIINNLEVTDTLPQFVTFASGPGNFDPNTNKMTFTIPTLSSGESKTYYVSTKVVNNPALSNNNFMCTTNYVVAKEGNGASADDSSQFCITKVYKQVQGLKQTPPTGPEAIALPMLFGMGGMGWFLRRKTK